MIKFAPTKLESFEHLEAPSQWSYEVENVWLQIGGKNKSKSWRIHELVFHLHVSDWPIQDKEVRIAQDDHWYWKNLHEI